MAWTSGPHPTEGRRCIGTAPSWCAGVCALLPCRLPGSAARGQGEAACRLSGARLPAARNPGIHTVHYWESRTGHVSEYPETEAVLKSPRFWTCSSRWVRLHSVEGLFLRVWVFRGARLAQRRASSSATAKTRPPAAHEDGICKDFGSLRAQFFLFPFSEPIVSHFILGYWPKSSDSFQTLHKVGENWVCERTLPP